MDETLHQNENPTVLDDGASQQRDVGGRLAGRLVHWVWPSEYPALDVKEYDTHIELTADVPGLSIDDIALKVRDNVLTIAGVKEAVRAEKGSFVHCAERPWGRFSREYTLPEVSDYDSLAAVCLDGVLTVVIRKKLDISGDDG